MDVFYICVGACVICVMVCVCIYQVYQMYLENEEEVRSNKSEHLYFALWQEFAVEGHCAICGNSGLINSVAHTSAGKRLELKDAPCICPNGRQLKAQRDG